MLELLKQVATIKNFVILLSLYYTASPLSKYINYILLCLGKVSIPYSMCFGNKKMLVSTFPTYLKIVEMIWK
jgi:hypothetical protein